MGVLAPQELNHVIRIYFESGRLHDFVEDICVLALSFSSPEHSLRPVGAPSCDPNAHANDMFQFMFSTSSMLVLAHFEK